MFCSSYREAIKFEHADLIEVTSTKTIMLKNYIASGMLCCSSGLEQTERLPESLSHDNGGLVVLSGCEFIDSFFRFKNGM